MSSTPFTRRKFLLTAAAATSSTMLLAACGGGDGAGGGEATAPAAEKVTQAQIDEAMNKDTTLTFWTWVPGIQKEIDLFEKKYPKVKVKLVNVGQGAAHYQKMRAAIQSGQGAPDVAQVEFQHVPSFTLGGNLLDISPYVAPELSAQYPDWVWSQVSRGDVVYSIPQDTGPTGLLYREDLLKAANIEPPKTWDEFATASVKYHQQNPDSYFSNFAQNEAFWYVALVWQTGARPFSFDGEKTVKIDLASEQSKQVAKYWGDLLAKDAASVDPDFADTWYQGLANGKYATWPTAAWGPIFLQGTAKKTSGKWRATDLPQWDLSKPTAGNWGGSTDAVLKSSQNPIAAAQLALFINTDPESAMLLASEPQFLFPASNTILNDPEFADQESEFYGGQKVNAKFTEISKTVSPDFEWLPIMDFVVASYTETLAKSIAAKADLLPGLQAWQDQVSTYAKDQGFTVS